jgi:hypothetical protein
MLQDGAGRATAGDPPPGVIERASREPFSHQAVSGLRAAEFLDAQAVAAPPVINGHRDEMRARGRAHGAASSGGIGMVLWGRK